MDLVNEMVSQFSESKSDYDALSETALKLLSDTIGCNDIHIHSIQSRVKSKESLLQKLKRPDRTYLRLDEISDLVGLRVITFFESDIELLAALVESSFQIDLDKSVDKRKILDSTEFGYRSLHYICRLPIKGCWPDQVKSISFEIQIRTILQHGWAEIEHDLGYKQQESIPHQMRRKFSRLAGLLEMADEEFCEIKKELDQYTLSIEHKMKENSANLKTDIVSLKSYLNTPFVSELDRAMAGDLGLEPDHQEFFPDYLIKMLHYVELDTISKLDLALKDHQSRLGHFIEPYFQFTKATWNFGVEELGKFQKGYSVFFLCHLLAYGKSKLNIERIDSMMNFYRYMDGIENPETLKSIALEFVNTMNEKLVIA